MNIMQSFTMKSLKRNKKRTVVTIIGVVISAALLTAVTIFVASLVSMVQRSAIADNGDWHARIRGVEAQYVSTITDSDKIDKAVLGRDIGYAAFGSENFSKPYLYIRQYNADGFAQMSVRITSGRLPENSHEVIISDNVGKSSGVTYAAGDTIALTAGQRINPDGEEITDNSGLQYEIADNGDRIPVETFAPEQTVKYTVVGTMDPPGIESSYSAGYAILGYLDENALSAGDTVDVYLTVSGLSRDIYNTVPALAAQAGVSTDNVSYNNELLRYCGVVSQDNVYIFIQGFMVALIIIIMLASITLIYNAFAISVSERARQLGLLSSLGATRRQKRASIYFEGFFIGLIGVPLGILAGIGGIAITLAAIQPLLDSFLSLSADVRLTLIVPPMAIVATVILSAITIFISAWIPARRASRIMPIDAIRLTKEVKLTRKTVRTPRLARFLFGFEAEIALKNLKRSRKKYRATIVSLVISLVLFLTVSTYMSLTTALSGVSYDGYNYDIGIVYAPTSGAEREVVNENIISLDEVKDYSVTETLYGTMPLDAEALSVYTKQYIQDGQSLMNVNLICLDDKSFSNYAKTAGVNAADFTDPRTPKVILINYAQDYIASGSGEVKKSAGEILNIRPGERVSFTPGNFDPEAGDDFGQVELAVGAVTDERPMGTLMQNFYTVTFVAARPVYERLTAEVGKGVLAENLQYATYLTTDADQRLEKQVSTLTEALPADAYIHNIKSASRSEQNLQLFLGIFVYGFIILISLICIANIFNTVSTNIALRRREFAMLRSVGMSPKGFNRMVRFESIFYGLKGVLYGIPISIVIAYLLFGMQQSVLESTFTLPWKSYGFAVLMLLVIVFSTMFYATAKIKKENILDTLKEENT